MLRGVDMETKTKLMADLLHIAEETRDFSPPYIPSYYLQDVTNSGGCPVRRGTSRWRSGDQ